MKKEANEKSDPVKGEKLRKVMIVFQDMEPRVVASNGVYQSFDVFLDGDVERLGGPAPGQSEREYFLSLSASEQHGIKFFNMILHVLNDMKQLDHQTLNERIPMPEQH